MGSRPGRGLCDRPRRLPGGRRGAEAESVEIDVGRAGIRPGPDRERPAGADGGQHRRHARPGEGRRQVARQPGEPSSPAIRLGEYSALAAAGALQLADTARLLKLRGQSMQKAVPVGEGAMAALLGIELEPAQEACKEAAQGEVVTVRQRQWRRPGRGERPQGRRRALHRDGQAARRQARHAAAGERALPLPADAARRRCHGRGAGRR